MPHVDAGDGIAKGAYIGAAIGCKLDSSKKTSGSSRGERRVKSVDREVVRRSGSGRLASQPLRAQLDRCPPPLEI